MPSFKTSRTTLIRNFGLALAILITTFSIVEATSASGKYECHKPYVPYFWDIRGNPNGRWLPTHNTRNWEYKSVPGWDYFQKKSNPSKKVELKCKPSLGFHQRDVEGYTDKCGYQKGGYSEKIGTPTCKTAGLQYRSWNGACLTTQGLAPNKQPSQFIIPFGDASFCKNGGTLRHVKKYPIVALNARKLTSMEGVNLTCPAGEKYSVQVKNSLHSIKSTGKIIFSVPDNVSKMFFSASVKPTVHVKPYLSEPLGFMINDKVESVANTHVYFPSNGPGLDFGRTAFSIDSQTTNKAIFQARWEDELFPNFVQFGVNLDMTPNSGIVPNISGGKRTVVARFGGSTGSKPRTEVSSGKLEYCAKLKIIKHGASAFSNGLPPVKKLMIKPKTPLMKQK